MNLVQMSLTGSVMILVIAGLRALFLNKLPKKMFLVLWWIALARLLLPVSLPSQFSVYSLLQQQEFLSDAGNWRKQEESGQVLPYQEKTILSKEEGADGTAEELMQGTAMQADGSGESAGSRGSTGSIWGKFASIAEGEFQWSLLWMMGMILSGVFFFLAYVRSSREFCKSFPVEEEKIKSWEEHHKIRRRISVRWSERIQTPLSYGIMHPVILMPKCTDWNEERQLAYVLEHEYVHVKRLDAVTKLILTAVLCIHWFNPLVWIMYFLFNRDLEISCDEEVVRHFGEDTRAGYARALISMEEKKAGFTSLCNGFGKIAIEERIKAIMKIKKTSVIALAAAVILVLAVALGFGTTAKAGMREQKEHLKSVLDNFYTEKESEMLVDLWLDDYENMTVSKYQAKVWEMTDTPEYVNLLDTFSYTIWAIETDDKEGEALNEYLQYYDHVLAPLCAEKWEKREFSDAVIWREAQVYTMAMPEQGNTSADTAILEYVIALHIENPDKLTTAQYRDTLMQTKKDMEEILRSKNETELADAQFMDQHLKKETERIASERSNENLTVAISGYSFFPLERVKSAAGQISDNGQGDAGKGEDAVLLEDVLLKDRENRRYAPASKEDYDSFLELMKPDYESMSVADFDGALLDWCNEDYDRMERIGEDAMQGEYGRTLTAKEKSFVDLTFGLSREENHRLVNNMRAGEPEKEENLRYGWINHSFYKSSDDGLAWVNCWYCFYWYITDKEKLTVGERDAGIQGFMEEAETALSDTDLDELLGWEKEDLMLLLKETAEEYSNGLLRIEIAEDNVSFEHMDERDLAAAREWKD